MPRIPPTLLRHARRINRLLPPLLPVCRDLASSQNELRWLGEHATEVAAKRGLVDEKPLLERYVNRRAKGEPLQYILGTEFFGDLEIMCRPGVLIPRQETAASVSHLALLLLQAWRKQAPDHPVNVLDLCTGTGSIPLLLHHELFSQPDNLPNIGHIVGVDVSPQALTLAEENKANQLREQEIQHPIETARLDVLRNMQFIKGDLLLNHEDEDDIEDVAKALLETGREQPSLDYEIIISNPPYISTSAFQRTTAASVRKYEPKLALVPPPSLEERDVEEEDGDLFYSRIYDMADICDTKLILFEVADMEQACRVAEMAYGRWETVEIWRDDPGANDGEAEYVHLNWQGQHKVRVWGKGNGRSVVAYRTEDAKRYINRGE